MEKQTKILIGLAVLGAAAYLYFRPKSNYKSDGTCAEGYDSFGSTGKIICEKKCEEGYEREMSVGGIGKCVKKGTTNCQQGYHQAECDVAPCPCIKDILLGDNDFTVKCNDGTTDVGNGVVAPCKSNGGVVGTTPNPPIIFAKCMAIGC